MTYDVDLTIVYTSLWVKDSPETVLGNNDSTSVVNTAKDLFIIITLYNLFYNNNNNKYCSSSYISN